MAFQCENIGAHDLTEITCTSKKYGGVTTERPSVVTHRALIGFLLHRGRANMIYFSFL